ncbi:hypothetical protein IMG5_055680, partial [Ichthyophthirius multifiliis]
YEDKKIKQFNFEIQRNIIENQPIMQNKNINKIIKKIVNLNQLSPAEKNMEYSQKSITSQKNVNQAEQQKNQKIGNIQETNMLSSQKFQHQFNQNNQRKKTNIRQNHKQQKTQIKDKSEFDFLEYIQQREKTILFEQEKKNQNKLQFKKNNLKFQDLRNPKNISLPQKEQAGRKISIFYQTPQSNRNNRKDTIQSPNIQTIKKKQEIEIEQEENNNNFQKFNNQLLKISENLNDSNQESENDIKKRQQQQLSKIPYKEQQTTQQQKQIYKQTTQSKSSKKNEAQGDVPVQQWDIQKAFQLLFGVEFDDQKKNNQIEENIQNIESRANFQSYKTNNYTNISVNDNIKIIQQQQTQTNILNEQEKKNLEQQNQEDPNQKLLIQPIDKDYNDIFNLFMQKAEQQRFVIDLYWSGEDTLPQSCFNKSERAIDCVLKSLNYQSKDLELYEEGIYGKIQEIRRQMKNIVNSFFFDNFIMICVVTNTFILTLDGLVNKEQESLIQQFNYIFTIIFTIDMGLKLLGLGIYEYLTDKMNIFDFIIVVLSLVELIFLESSTGISAFRSIRVLRVFRVLRVTRLIRSLQFMKIIIIAISSSIQSFIYILLLLFLFIFIYSLLGMQIFGGLFQFNKEIIRMNFDSFSNAFLTVFDVMTMENWNEILINCLRTTQNKFATILYFVSWIFIGNYVLLNLLLAIVMDSFDNDVCKEETLEWQQGIEIQQDIDVDFQSETTTQFNQSNVGLSSANMNQLQSFNKSQQMNKIQSFKRSQSKIKDQEIEQQKQENIQKKKLLFNIKGKKNFIYFENIACEKSYYLFSKQNVFRKICYRIIKHEKFEDVIMGSIILSSFNLIIDTYFNDFSNPKEVLEAHISSQIGIAFTGFYTIELLFKSIAYGFILDDNSYLREGWSWLDLFIVVSSLVDACLDSINLSSFKIIRLLRTLRPLRFIQQNKSMKLIVTALIESVSGILNVVLVVLLIWIMFAILGMNFLQGKLNYCDFPQDGNTYSLYDYDKQKVIYKNIKILQVKKKKCNQIQGAEWKTHDINFDNIGNSMLSLFILSTIEAWPNYVWNFVDADENGPKKDNYYWFIIYVIVFILIGSMFLLNLFVAIMSLNYNLAAEKAKNEFLTEEQAQWIELQRLLIKSKPDYTSLRHPENKIRKFIWIICESSIYQTFVMICILLNVIAMAFAYDTSPVEYDYIMNIINLSFTSVFISEAILKLFAYGIRGYFYDSWNQFDFFVVMASLLDIFLTFSGKKVISFLKIGPQIARIFRISRVTRLLRLIKSFEGLNKLIQTAVFSLPSLLNAVALLFLVYFIFAILAVHLFLNIKTGKVINEFQNFENFHKSIILLFICSTGEDWPSYMFDVMKGNPLNCIFFISFIITVQFVMMNLFVLIIIDQFEQNYINKDNPLNHFSEYEKNFKFQWVKYTKDTFGIKINEKYISKLYFKLQEPLGYGIYITKNIQKIIYNQINLQINIQKVKYIKIYIQKQYINIYIYIQQYIYNYIQVYIFIYIYIILSIIIIQSQILKLKRKNTFLNQNNVFQILIKKISRKRKKNLNYFNQNKLTNKL